MIRKNFQTLPAATIIFIILASCAYAIPPRHNASAITGGTFNSGNYTFPDSLNITNFLEAASIFFINPITQRIGIGTESPQTTLHVIGDSRIEGSLNVTGDVYLPVNSLGGCTGKLITSADGNITCGSDESFNQTYDTWAYNQTTPAIDYVNQQGYLMNGSSAELTSLNVSGVIDAYGMTVNGTDVGTGSGDLTNVAYVNQSNTFAAGQIIDNTSAVTDAYLNISDGNSQKFIVDSAGNVGIGTASPDATLDINGRLSINGYSAQLNTEYLPAENLPISIDTVTYDGFGFISQFPDGKLVIIYRQGASHVGVGDYGIGRMITSTDGGADWSAATTIKSEAGVDIRNLGGGVTPNGRLVVFYVRYNPDTSTTLSEGYIYSDDEGVTWSTYQTISVGSDTAFSPYGGIIPIGNGKLMQPLYGDDGGVNYSSYVIFSSDNGKTWGTKTTVLASTTIFTEGSYAYLGGGAIVGLIRKHDVPVGFTQVKSVDNGLTWTNQGDVTFDTWSNSASSPAWLTSYKDDSGRRTVAAYYYNRRDNKLKVILGQDLLSGVGGWMNWTLTTLGTYTSMGSGYPTAINPYNDKYTIGWFFDEISDSDADITFFSYPPNHNFVITNNVGIGTTNPGTAKLNVTGVVDAYGITVNGTNVGTGSGDLTNVAYVNQSNTFTAGQVIDNTSAVTDAYLNISDGNTPKFIVDSSGKVGIGTTSPGQLLEVSSASAPTIRIRNTVYSPPLYYDLSVTDSGGLYLAYNGTKTVLFGTGGGVGIGAYGTGAYTPPANGMIISGKVGIGTTSPVQKLNVEGDANITGDVFLPLNSLGGCTGKLTTDTDGNITCATDNTYNSTYDLWAYNQTTPAIDYVNGQGYLINESDPLFTAENASLWSEALNKFNQTYDTWAYNQTTPAIDYANQQGYLINGSSAAKMVKPNRLP